MEKKEGSNSKSRVPIPTGSSGHSITPMMRTTTPSPISIGSIEIDLSGYSGLMQDKSTTTPCTCNHFSIRGYTAEMRKKNIKACLPFATMEGDFNQLGNILPPLEVPQFKYWNCQNCVNKINMNLANVAASSVNGDGQKDLQQGIKERGISGTKANPVNLDEIEKPTPFGSTRSTTSTLDQSPPRQLNVNRADQNPTVPKVNRSFKEKKHGEVGSCSMSSLIGKKEVHAYNSRLNYEKIASLGSRRLPTDNNIIKQKLQKSNGSGSSNFPKAGETGSVRNREINPSVFLGGRVGLTGSTVGSSKQAEMRNFHQSQNRLMNNDKEVEVEVPLDLNKAGGGWSSYTSLLLGQEPGRNGMENRQIPTLADQEGVGNSKRKRVNSDTDSSLQKTRLLTDLLKDSDRNPGDFHGKDSGNAASAGNSTSISNSSSKELETHKNLLETFFKPPNLVWPLGRKNLLCDLNEEIPPNFEMPNSNHQLDLSSGGSSSRDQPTDKHTMDQIHHINQTMTAAASANLFKNHYNIEQIAKNKAVSNFSNQSVAESKQSSSDGNWSNSNSNNQTSSTKGSDGNWSNPSNNNNGQKSNLPVFEKYTENPWISKRFKIDLNKEAIDPSEAIPAMQLLSLKNATGFKMPSSGFTFGSFSLSSSSTQKTKEASSSSTETTPVINFGPEYLNSGGRRESISPYQSMDFEKEKQELNELGESEDEGRLRSISVNDLCSFNRNPAEINELGVRNEYMINGQDLKFEKEKRKGRGKAKVAVSSSSKGKRGSRSRGVVIDGGRKRKKKKNVSVD